MTEQETQRVAIVTGAGRGIGRAIALALAREGYALTLAARTFAELEETRRLSGLDPARSLIVLIDLAAEEAPQELFDAALAHFGRIDVLVNNAGWAPPRTPLAAAQMVTQGGGAIVNIASAAARVAPAGEAIYAAAKAGMVVFSRAAFAELRERDVKLAVVIPGLADTALIPHNKRLDRMLM